MNVCCNNENWHACTDSIWIADVYFYARDANLAWYVCIESVQATSNRHLIRLRVELAKVQLSRLLFVIHCALIHATPLTSTFRWTSLERNFATEFVASSEKVAVLTPRNPSPGSPIRALQRPWRPSPPRWASQRWKAGANYVVSSGWYLVDNKA